MGKRDELRQKQHANTVQQRIIFISAIVGLIIIAGILIIPGMIKARQQAVSIITPTEFARPRANGRSMGDPNAPVKITEYADFLCSHCMDFALEKEPEFVAKYVETGQVYYTYSPFLLQADYSSRLAEASFCAMDQGKFWEYHDMIYSNLVDYTGDPTDDAHLKAYAKNIGLDGDALGKCVSNDTYKQTVADLTQKGKDAGVQGTPTFDVNGKLVYQDQLEATIAEALKAAGK
jgi:protein-disulfide isomerase